MTFHSEDVKMYYIAEDIKMKTKLIYLLVFH